MKIMDFINGVFFPRVRTFTRARPRPKKPQTTREAAEEALRVIFKNVGK